MSKLGKRLIKAADEALAIARGEAEVERTVTYRGIKIEPTMGVGKRSPAAQAIRDDLLRTKSEQAEDASARQLNLFKGKRQRGERVDVSPSEFQLHCQVADTLERWRSANWVSTHFPAGEERTPAAGARLKRMGLQPGIPDVILFPPKEWREPRTHFLELKRHGGRLTAAQAEFELWARANHYPFQIADSYELALATLQQWGAVRTGIKAQ